MSGGTFAPTSFGGGIAPAVVGDKTQAYTQYFKAEAGGASTGGQQELTQKRLENYADVVNSCAQPRAGGPAHLCQPVNSSPPLARPVP